MRMGKTIEMELPSKKPAKPASQGKVKSETVPKQSSSRKGSGKKSSKDPVKPKPTLSIVNPTKSVFQSVASQGKPETISKQSSTSKGSGKKSSNKHENPKPKPSLSIVNSKKSVFHPMSNGTISSIEVTDPQPSSHEKLDSSSKQKSVTIDSDSDADDFDLTSTSNIRTPQSCRPVRQSAKRAIPIIDSDSDDSLDFGEESREPPRKKPPVSQRSDDSEIVLLDD